MADYNPTTVATLIAIGVGLNLTPGIDKQLVRFKLAAGHTDPNLLANLANADLALVAFLGDMLARAIYNAP